MVEKQIMIPIDDERAKYLSDVLGNKTAMKILDYLSENEGTVSDISRALKIPLNTADYNVKKLVGSGLIEKADWFWSRKGKKMPTYRVSDKKIVISPKKKVFSDKIKSMFLALGLTGLGALVVRELTRARGVFSGVENWAGDVLMQRAAEDSLAAVEGGSYIGVSVFTNIGPWGWFLIGAWFAIVLFFIISILKGGKD